MMSPKTIQLNTLTTYVMSELPGEALVLLNADSVEHNQAALFLTELLNSSTPYYVISKGLTLVIANYLDITSKHTLFIISLITY